MEGPGLPNERVSSAPSETRRPRPRAIRRVLVFVTSSCLLAALMAGGAPFATAGRVFYVSPSGSDTNGGTIAEPFHTLGYAMSVLRPGDTLFVRGGIYAQKVAPTLVPGTSTQPITVASYQAESALIQGSLSLTNPSYWTIRGLDVIANVFGKQSGGLVRFNGGTGWSFESSNVRRARGGSGIVVTGGAKEFTLRDLFVHDMIVFGKKTADLIRVEWGSDGVIERSLLVGSPRGAGVRLGSSSTSSGNVVRYNTMYANLGNSNVVLSGSAIANRIERNIMVLPAAGNPNVTGSGLTGSGNEVLANIGWGSTAVFQSGLVGLADEGGNLHVDPQFVDAALGDFHTKAPVAEHYGRYAVITDSPPVTPPPPTTSPTPTVPPTPTLSPTPTVAPPPPPTPSPTPPPPVTIPAGRLYSSSSFWNTPIPSSPAIDANSSAMVQAALVAYKSNANFANTDGWGIPIVYARSSDKLYNVACTKYDCGTSVSFRIPAGAKPTTGSDHHLVVIDGDKELDMWGAVYNASHDSWSASSRYVTDAYGWGAMCALGEHCNGAVAAGFAAFGGIPRPEEFSEDVIAHALTITTPLTKSGIIACPATHSDGKSTSAGALPEGARIQLDPSFNVNAQSWSNWMKVMARTLQVYGAYVSDTGGTLAIRGEADLNRPGAWSDAGIPEGANLSALPWDKMRVLDITAC